MSEQTTLSFVEAKILAKALDSEINQLDNAWDIGIKQLAGYIKEKKLLQQLTQFVANGPVADGDVSSKIARDYLFDLKLITRVMNRGEMGYTAANYMGGFVLKACFETNDQYLAYIKSNLR